MAPLQVPNTPNPFTLRATWWPKRVPGNPVQGTRIRPARTIEHAEGVTEGVSDRTIFAERPSLPVF